MSDDAAPADGSGPKDRPGRLRPTIIVSEDGRPRVAEPKRASPARFATPSPTVTVPTAIPGVERKRIAVTATDVAHLGANVAPAIAAHAVRLVEGFVVEGARDRQVILWGHAAQQEYADLVSRTLELSQDDVLDKVRSYVRRITDLLSAIDLESICGVAPAAGAIGRLFRRANDRIDTPRELDAARRELDHLVRLTSAALEPLLTLRDAIEQQSLRIDVAGDSVEAAALSAAFLSEHLRDAKPALSRHFLDRSLNLTATALQIRGSVALRESQIEQPLCLIAAIQDVVLVTLPGWLSGLSALTNMAPTNRAPTPTEAGELAFTLRTILQQLKI